MSSQFKDISENQKSAQMKELKVDEQNEEIVSSEKKQENTLNEKEKYMSISEDGDTLELSSTADNANDGTIIIKESSKIQITDATLAKCSKSKLKLLLENGKITKQQYEKAIKASQKSREE